MGAPEIDHSGRGQSFATTQWSLVLSAGGDLRESKPRAALAALCANYWRPLYGYARRRGESDEAAQDLTQEFVLRLLDGKLIAAADPRRGRFRAFLLASFRNFLISEWQHARAQKRGGRRAPLSLDWASEESKLLLEPADGVTPEIRFEQAWATTLLERVLGQLREEMEAAGKERQFDLLKGALTGDRERLPYAEVAAQLDCSPEAARQAAHRMRTRYRELLRDEVAQTVADPQDVDDEIRQLFVVFAQ